jgi:hypothetical protein
MCGVLPGKRWNCAMGMTRSPRGLAITIEASSAASATFMSEGLTAMQALLAPRIACTRL